MSYITLPVDGERIPKGRPSRTNFTMDDASTIGEWRDFIRKMATYGIFEDGKLLHVAGVEGYVTTEQMICFQNDPWGLYEQFYGGHREEIMQWLENHGAVQCSAITNQGSHCKNIASRTQLEFSEWLSRQGAFCHKHAQKSVNK